jgi:hypothetical protein
MDFPRKLALQCSDSVRAPTADAGRRLFSLFQNLWGTVSRDGFDVLKNVSRFGVVKSESEETYEKMILSRNPPPQVTSDHQTCETAPLSLGCIVSIGDLNSFPEFLSSADRFTISCINSLRPSRFI